VTLSLQLGFDPDVAYWIGRWGLLAIVVPFWILLLHVVNAFMMRRSPRPWRSVVFVLAVIPGLLLLLIGAIHLAFSGYLYGQISAEDCTSDAPLADKRRLQLAYMEGFILYIGCYQRMLQENGGAALPYRPTLQDCQEWVAFQQSGGVFNHTTPLPSYAAQPATVTMAPAKAGEEATAIERIRSWNREHFWNLIFAFWERISNWTYLNAWLPFSTWVWENFLEPMYHLFGIQTSDANKEVGGAEEGTQEKIARQARSAQTSWDTAKEDIAYGVDRIGENTEIREGSHRRWKKFVEQTNEDIEQMPVWQHWNSARTGVEDGVANAGADAWELHKNISASTAASSWDTVKSAAPASLWWKRMEHEREYKYLASMEANHVCAGFCQPGPNLFTDYDVSGKQGSKCAPIVAHKFLVVQHEAQQLFTVSVIAVTLVVVFLQCARGAGQRVGYRTPVEEFD
jgi:hypothetical protein